MSQNQKLTMGYRCRVHEGAKNTTINVDGQDCILLERSRTQGNTSWAVMVLSKEMTHKKLVHPFTQDMVWGHLAWIDNEDLQLIDTNIDVNVRFVDWAKDMEENSCPDCGYFDETMRDDSKERECPECECVF